MTVKDERLSRSVITRWIAACSRISASSHFKTSDIEWTLLNRVLFGRFLFHLINLLHACKWRRHWIWSHKLKLCRRRCLRCNKVGSKRLLCVRFTPLFCLHSTGLAVTIDCKIAQFACMLQWSCNVDFHGVAQHVFGSRYYTRLFCGLAAQLGCSVSDIDVQLHKPNESELIHFERFCNTFHHHNLRYLSRMPCSTQSWHNTWKFLSLRYTRCKTLVRPSIAIVGINKGRNDRPELLCRWWLCAWVRIHCERFLQHISCMASFIKRPT